MNTDIINKIFTNTIRIYLGYSDDAIKFLIENPSYSLKERIKRIEHLEVLIYSLDHHPPHFHVKSNDLKIDAKFSIETGEHLSGKISSNDRKKIKAFYDGPKGKIALELIWQKFHK